MNKKQQSIGVIISFFAIALFLIYLILSIFSLNDETLVLTAMLVTVIISACLCFFVSRNYRKSKKLIEIDYLNIGIQRYILGITMIFYGLPKLFGTFFDYQLFALDSKLINVSEFQLAWFYFGKNKWQELFAGFMELIPGLLLLRRLTYYLAAIILLPVTAQVFILNLFFKIGGITFPAATILLLCNLYIIYSQKEKIILFFKSLNFFPQINLSNTTQKIIRLGRLFIITIVVFLFYNNLKPIFFKSADKLKYEALIGIYRFESMTKNAVNYQPTNDSVIYKDIYIEKQSRWNILRKFNNKTDAFIMNLTGDSMRLYINEGGTGDEKDVLDSISVLKGKYTFKNELLTISGIQLNDTLTLNYRKQPVKPKKWFWK